MIQQFADWLVYGIFGLDAATSLGVAVNFFFYDTIKIIILLFSISFVMGIINAYFPIERLRQYLATHKLYGLDYFLAALFGGITPFCSCSSVPLFIGFVKGGIPLGVTEFKGVVSVPESISPIFCKFEFDKIFTIDMLVVVFTFLFIDLFDTIGTLIGVCGKANMVDKDGNIYRVKHAFMADSIATTAGAVLGTSTTTTYVESAAGVAEGGRSGLTAFVVAVCFAVSLFFSPLFLSIPAAATTAALVIVGMLMLESVRKIPFNDYCESIPAFICIVMMPLTYSISNGIMLGMISYVVLNMLCGKFQKITPTMYVLAVLFILKFIFI